MTAPTEAEIRAMVDPDFADTGSLNAAGRLSDAFGYVVCLDRLYDQGDLRQSEKDALDQAVYDVMVPIRDRAIAELREAVFAAGLRFAAEHPDAPRAREEVPA